MENTVQNTSVSLLIDESDISEERVNVGCFKRLFCCCLLSQKLSKNHYIKQWRRYLAKETISKKQFEDPFKVLTNLFAHKNVIKTLEKLRLNPNITKPNPIRTDLEFYIPQLCTFLIFGHYEIVEEFIAFLCKACYASFYFAHRTIWFLKSFLGSESEYDEKILDYINLIQSIFKSEKQKNVITNVFIASSEKFLEQINKMNYTILFKRIKENDMLSLDQSEILANKNRIKQVIGNHSEEELIYSTSERQKNFSCEKKIGFEEFYLDVFKFNDYSNKHQQIKFENLPPVDLDDLNLSSFLSSVNFIDNLCNICEILRVAPPEDQIQILRKEITEVNKSLPSNVYIPFLSEKIRNYIIVHIPVTELKIFKTKNRAPYMITIEVVRIEELTKFYENKSNGKSRQIESFNSRKDSISNKNFNKNNKNTDLYLENDIELSKPLTIRTLSKVGYQNVGINEENFEDFFKIDTVLKKRVNKSQIEKPNKKDNLSDNDNYIKHVESSITQKTNGKLLESLTDGDIQIKIKTNFTDIKEEINKNDSSRIEQNTSNEDDQLSALGIEDDNNKLHDGVFGEKFEDQMERLKSASLFGSFKSWKAFKVIVKSGEDLRQEQFASQLINEFNQIFQLEKVSCWLKPYEILATGHNVGILECVPNSVSLDYLKKKTQKFTNLRSYFENYFGPPNRSRFKTAINNFVKSLAGYSLLCYFLQIKDRHNGNILIDDQGHIIHIDFGFMLSNAPGKGLEFERAPFKLTNEFVEIMGGFNSPYFSKFRQLLYKGFIAASKHSEKIIILVEMMLCGHGNSLPCFEKGDDTIQQLRNRFTPRKNMNNVDYISHVDDLISLSIDNWRTKWYDKFQYYVQGIFY